MRRRAGRLAVAAAAAGLALAGCGPAGGSPQARVRNWAAGSGIVGLDAQVASDVSSIQRALTAGDTTTAKDLCSALNDDVGAAYDELPSPDPQLTALLNDADTSIDKGAVDCQTALGGQHGLLATSLGEIRRGRASLQAADRRLQSFGVSTTATGVTGGS